MGPGMEIRGVPSDSGLSRLGTPDVTNVSEVVEHLVVNYGLSVDGPSMGGKTVRGYLHDLVAHLGSLDVLELRQHAESLLAYRGPLVGAAAISSFNKEDLF